MLPYYDHDSSFSCALRTHVELGGDAYSRFRMFRDASGLAYIVSAEFKTLVDAREKAVKGIRSMSTAPDTLEILDGSDCQRCRNYFGKTGPVCRHCKLKDVVKAYEKCMYGFRRSLKMTVNNTSNSTKGMKGRKSLKKNSKISTINESNRLVNNSIDELDSSDEIDIRELDREQIDGPFLMIAKQMRSLASRVGRRDLIEVAATELRWLAAIEVELRCMNLSWNRHLELLKSHDEIVMCVSRLQLATGSENSVEFIREYELEDSATEAMNSAIVSECDLRSSLSTFNFYREQEAKIRISMTEYGTSMGTKMALTVSPMSNNLTNKSATRMTDDAALHKMQKDMNDDCCIICREPLFPSESRDDSDGTLVAVLLPCAHVFHKACISQWLAKREACVICKAKTKLTDLVVIEKPQAIMRDTRQVPC